MLHRSLFCGWNLWMLALCLFGVHWFMPKRVVDLLAWWEGWFSRHRNGDIWNAISLCIMWTIWKERNNRVFELRTLTNLWCWSSECSWTHYMSGWRLCSVIIFLEFWTLLIAVIFFNFAALLVHFLSATVIYVFPYQ